MIQISPGDLCVLRDGTKDRWSVCICGGGGNRREIARFIDRSQAVDYAVEQRARRVARKETPVIHFPDDCPCFKAQGVTDCPATGTNKV